VNALLISFNDKAIRKICEDEAEAQHVFDTEIAMKLQTRLADLAAAKSVSDIIIGNPCEIKDTPHYKIDLSNNYILIFAANNIDIPRFDDQSIKWAEITRVKILEIKENI
jgi:plasmid maintenance system killer protein